MIPRVKRTEVVERVGLYYLLFRPLVCFKLIDSHDSRVFCLYVDRVLMSYMCGNASIVNVPVHSSIMPR